MSKYLSLNQILFYWAYLLLLFIGFFFIYIYFIMPYKLVPSLKLRGNDKVVISYKQDYNETGYDAKIGKNDATSEVNIDGIVDNTKVGNYIIKYTLSNSKGKNAVTKTREVSVIDTDNPLIALNGASTINLYVGDTYEEPGYQATDEYDGDITDEVIVSGNIDNKIIGTYNLLYSVDDSSGNAYEISRTIKVNSRPVITSGIGIPVLMYHFFYDSSVGETAKDSNYIDIKSFEEQVKYLHENNYYFATWDELNRYIDGTLTLPKKSIIITIDDGNESFFRLAYNVLVKYNTKATSFIVTSWTNLNNANVDRSLIDFESHTNDMHRGGCKSGRGGIFQCINYNDGYNDLTTSKNIIGSSEVLAYPFGDYNDATIKLLKDTGYKMAVTTEYGKVRIGANKYALPRIRIQGYYKLNDFINAIK